MRKLRWRHGTGDLVPYKAEGSRATYRIFPRDGGGWTAHESKPGRKTNYHGPYATPSEAKEACERLEDQG